MYYSAPAAYSCPTPGPPPCPLGRACGALRPFWDLFPSAVMHRLKYSHPPEDAEIGSEMKVVAGSSQGVHPKVAFIHTVGASVDPCKEISAEDDTYHKGMKKEDDMIAQMIEEALMEATQVVQPITQSPELCTGETVEIVQTHEEAASVEREQLNAEAKREEAIGHNNDVQSFVELFEGSQSLAVVKFDDPPEASAGHKPLEKNVQDGAPPVEEMSRATSEEEEYHIVSDMGLSAALTQPPQLAPRKESRSWIASLLPSLF